MLVRLISRTVHNALQADQYCTADEDSQLFPMLLVRVCLGSSVGSTGRDGEKDPVVPSLTGRMMQKIGIGDPSKYFRSAQAVASKMSKVMDSCCSGFCARLFTLGQQLG